MADILWNPTASGIKNGSAFVRYSDLSSDFQRPELNSTREVVNNSGVLDSRFDEIRYYTSSG